MKISKRSLILLCLVIIIIPLIDNNHLFQLLRFRNINKLISFVVPAIYFLSFFYDIIKNKFIPSINPMLILLSVNFIVLLISFVFSISYNVYNFTNLINFIYIFLFIYSIHIYSFEE